MELQDLSNVLNGFLGADELGLLIGIIADALLLIFVRRYHKNKIIILLLTLALALLATIISAVLVFEADQNKGIFVLKYISLSTNSITLVLSLLVVIAFWSITFHVAAETFGPWLTACKPRFFPSFGNHWVRLIDYFYLLISTCSIFKIAVHAANDSRSEIYVDALSAVFLGISVALRITKTSIEIFEWNNILDLSGDIGSSDSTMIHVD